MSAYVLEVAVSLARANRAEIILLHTVLNELAPVPELIGGFSYNLNPYYQEVWQEADETLEKMAANSAYADVVFKKKLGSNIDGLIR